MKNLVNKVYKKLKENGYKVATAESCTGGLLAGKLIDVSGASDIIDMSFVTYSNEAKNELVGVSLETIDKYNVVSEEVAKEMAEGAALCGADRVELYTEPYADLFPTDPQAAILPFIKTAEAARAAGLGLNAGHDLNLENLEFFVRNIPWTDEVSIGHAIISDALYMGLEQTIKAYLSKVKIF